MDNYELKLRIDEIKDLTRKKEFGKAVEIADTINWSKVKQGPLICTISDIYKANKRYDDARLLLEMAYDMHPNNNGIVSALCDLCIRMEDIVGSTEYYKKYVQMDPNGVNRYILLYKIYDMQGVSTEEKIRVLEDLKKRDPIANKGKWSYELARLYEEVGLTTKCVEECDDLIMLVREGRYVKKAMDLKMLHQQLTQSQEALYKSMIIANTGEFPSDLNLTGPVKTKEEIPEQTVAAEGQAESDAGQDIPATSEELYSTQDEGTAQESVTSHEEELVKTVDVGQYSTINIQKALEESIKGTLSDGSKVPVAKTTQAAADVLQDAVVAENTGSAEYDEEPDDNTICIPIKESVSEEISEQPVEAVMSETEREEAADLLKQDTGEMEEIIFPNKPATEDTIIYDPKTKAAAEDTKAPVKEKAAETAAEPSAEPAVQTAQAETHDALAGINIETVSKDELMRLIDQKVAAALENAMTKRAGVAPNTNPPKAIQGMLSEEYDGQIQIVIPEKKVVEKQITGQIELKEYLNDWESSKKRRQKNQEEKIDKLVSQHTDNLLAAFESATSNNELLDKIEKEAESLIPKAVGTATAALEAIDIEDETENTVTSDTDTLVIEPPKKKEEQPEKEPEKPVEEAAEEKQDTPVAEEEPEEEKSAEDKAKEAEDIAAAEAEAIDDEEDDSVRPMTEEETALFSQFVQTKKGKKELLKALDSISLASYVGNVCVTGETGEESVDLAKNVVQYAKTTDGNFSGKIGKVTGSSLNDKDIDMLVEKLSNGGLIIEKAGEMSEDTAAKLFKALNQENLGILVVLQDSRKAINRLLNYNDALKGMFNVRIEIEELSDDALVAYGRKYAERKEFAIDDMGILALHTRIDEMQTSDHIVTVTDIRDIVDEAIAHATKFNPKHFTDIVFGKRYNEDDMIILKEKDFIR